MRICDLVSLTANVNPDSCMDLRFRIEDFKKPPTSLMKKLIFTVFGDDISCTSAIFESRNDLSEVYYRDSPPTSITLCVANSKTRGKMYLSLNVISSLEDGVAFLRELVLQPGIFVDAPCQQKYDELVAARAADFVYKHK